MAEEKPAPPAEEPAAGEEATEAPVKGPLIPPILVRFSIVGGILVVLAVGAILLVTDVIAPRLRRLGAPPPSAEAAPAAAEEKHAPGEILTVGDIVVNPAGSGGRRYLKVAAAIEVVPEKGKKAKKAEGAEGGAGLGLEEVQIRDLLIRELSARTLEELTDPVAKEETRESIMEGLAGILGEGRVSNLYFTEYVVQ